jgi:hypothetical protein
MKKLLLVLFSFFMLAQVINAQSKVGTTSANFLTIGVGPRASAMGGAFTATADDATTAYWNPGGLSRLPRNEFNASYTEWLVGTKFNWFGIAFKMSDNDAVALSFNQLDYGEEEITTAQQPNGTGQRWDAQDLAIGLSYARNLTDRFSIGATIKYISQQIWNESSSAFALDIGLLFHTQLEGLRIGMNISNFGTEMKMEGKDLLQPVDIDPANSGNNENISAMLATDAWPLPLIFTIGLGYDITRTPDWVWIIASDAIYPNNQSSYLNVGTEITWNNLISLRGGYNSLLKEAAEEGFTAGVGLQYDFGGFFAKVDYSYSDFGIFSEISRFSLSVGL